EIRDHAEALDDRLRLPPARKVDHELGEDVDLDVLQPVERLVQECDALVEGEHGLLVLRPADDADHEPVEDAGGPLNHVDVAVRDRVEGTWVDGCDHGCWNSVMRAAP